MEQSKGGSALHAYIEMKMEPASPPVSLDYNYLVQAAIYTALPEDVAGHVHDGGCPVGVRTFKPFAFSRLMGKFIIDGPSRTIAFPESVRLVIVSPDRKFFQSLISRLFLQGRLVLGTARFDIIGIRFDEQLVKDETVYVRTLSPVVTYSTLLRPEGGKYTCFHQPGEGEFNRLVTGNLLKKYEAFYGSTPPSGQVHVRPLDRPRLHVTYYKGIVVKGYTCRLKLNGRRELLQLALDAGLGGKGSQGYGCLEKVEGRFGT
jgi:CRISPR-associated endoribonuclease Cas6